MLLVCGIQCNIHLYKEISLNPLTDNTFFFSHFNRESEDTALFFLKEIYKTMDIWPEQTAH